MTQQPFFGSLTQAASSGLVQHVARPAEPRPDAFRDSLVRDIIERIAHVEGLEHGDDEDSATMADGEVRGLEWVLDLMGVRKATKEEAEQFLAQQKAQAT